MAMHIERESGIPLQQQVVNQLRRAILDGRLPSGARLPSTRALARTLGVSRNVILAAYDDLFAEGYIHGKHGAGTFVLDELPQLPHEPVQQTEEVVDRRWLRNQVHLQSLHQPLSNDAQVIDFRLGMPSIDPLPGRLWRRLWREMAARKPPEYYGPPEGILELREAIASYLGRSRGIACHPDNILITTGAQQAINLIGRAVLRPGDAVAFEDPGHFVAATNLRFNGATILPVRVTSEGLDVTALAELDPAPILVYTTPSHQYPTGVRMPVAGRLALLDWARRHDSLIVEDDYDSEFRFDAAPLPALTGLDQEGRSVYIGTFSKMVSPAIRIGYIYSPPALHERLTLIKGMTDFQTSWALQYVMASFIQSGRLERHIRRMRRHYAEKRWMLGNIVGQLDDLAQLQGLEAGLHAFLALNTRLDPDAIVAVCKERNVMVTSIQHFYHGEPDRNGLLLGYGGLSLEEIEQGSNILIDVIKEAALSSPADES